MVKGGGRSWKTVWKSVWKKFGCVEDSVGKNGLWRTDFSRRPRENPKNVPQYFIIPIDESSPTEASPLPSTLKPFPRESKGPKKSGLRDLIVQVLFRGASSGVGHVGPESFFRTAVFGSKVFIVGKTPLCDVSHRG